MDVRNCDGILAALKERGGVDGIVSRSEVGMRAVAQMTHQLGLPSISDTAAANATSGSAMRRLWASKGFSTEFVQFLKSIVWVSNGN
jgi:hypothetical protein